jgi:transcriptional antiterminator Rof (Rho-off)
MCISVNGTMHILSLRIYDGAILACRLRLHLDLELHRGLIALSSRGSSVQREPIMLSIFLQHFVS